MNIEDLQKMELHEIKSIPCKSHDIEVMRVFGGWVYTQIGWNHETDSLEVLSMCFVPEAINVEAHTTDVTNRTFEFKE